MKFGLQLEEASVPEWSLHNIDYNSLKHQIKTHTSRDQATAIAIPGQKDQALQKFEESFYLELCDQHCRIGIFVTSKADEISYRLRHLSTLLRQLLIRCTDSRGVTVKRQRRFEKHRVQIDECNQDLKSLKRFVTAQVIGFRKILKKYKKWTGSMTLSKRFKGDVLSCPKSFTRRDFHALDLQYRELLATMDAASPHTTPTPDGSVQSEYFRSPPTTPISSRYENRRRSSRMPTSGPVPSFPTASTTYWNEYEYGSEAGDHGEDDAYAIYIDPRAEGGFPGLTEIKILFTAPVDKLRHWLGSRDHAHDQTNSTLSTPSTEPAAMTERQPLLSSANEPADYFSLPRPPTSATTDNDTTEDQNENENENDDASSADEWFVAGVHPWDDQKMARYRDRMLTRGVVVAFAGAFILLGIAAVSMATGRHKLRLEVAAGVTVGGVASLFCACVGLGCMLYSSRAPGEGLIYSLSVWAAFAAVCLLNGMMLLLVMGSNGI